MKQGMITAVLGPTNTGKTHYAIERMLAHRTGVIALPLRLLAREVYDRIVALRGPSVVALVTGEERIVPPRAQYWVATTEAMPEATGADFLAIDEIQMAADPERGHVFTDRLLRARGQKETMFLGADTMRPIIARLVPEACFVHRERFSPLAYTGRRKISRMPRRSAIVGFSVDSVYAIAELLRRQKGGAAVVLGALSPRTRNAQVALYQNGDVDYLVATDAIGMGLNLDIDHVAFFSRRKFDGARMRDLTPAEMGQIAGRAGRYMRPGSFGVTGDAPDLSPELAEALESHRFAPIERLQWRNARLDFASPERLIASLERTSDNPLLMRAREAEDLRTLRMLAADSLIRARIGHARDVRLLWEACQIPDFRNTMPAEHARLVGEIFTFLSEKGRIPESWLALRVARIDRTDGDIDTLSKRLAYVRTWTYVAQRPDWLEDRDHWRGVTRDLEDRLSDALHARLTQRFVDRRTSVLMRRLKEKENLVAEVNDKGEVTVEGEHVGRLEGFRFHQDGAASAEESKTLRAAALKALGPQFRLKAERLYRAPDTEFDITEQGGLMWGAEAVGRLATGETALRPRVVAFVDDEAGPEVKEMVERRLGHFVERRIATLFEPLFALAKDTEITGLARGLAFRLEEAMGVLPRAEVAEEVKALGQDERGKLRRHGVRFGQFTIFMPALLKPAPTRLRLVLWALAQGLDEFPPAPPAGFVTVEMPSRPMPEGYWQMAGYRPAGKRAIRVDMLERLADLIRDKDTRGGFEATADMLSITGLTLEQFADLMQGLGYRAERGERPKPQRRQEAGTAEEPAGKGGGEGARDPLLEDADCPDCAEKAGVEAGGGVPAETPAAEAAGAVAGQGGDGQRAAKPQSGAPLAEAAEPAAGAVANEEGTAGDETARMAGEEEIEVFYVFTWQPRRRARNAGPGRAAAKPSGKGRRKRKGTATPAAAAEGGRARKAKPVRRERPVDPDSPFAVLQSLKDRL